MDAIGANPANTGPLPTLTVAIPTYQRLRWLREGLSRVLEQVDALPAGSVEVIVSENAGSDGTWEHLQDEAATHPALRIHRNARNLGAEGNFHQLPGMARGRYLWMLGDDDFVLPGALATVLKHVASDPDFVALNVRLSDEDMRVEGALHWQIDEDVRTSSLDDVMRVVPHFAMGFISAWVCRREMFNMVDRDIFNRFERWGLSLMVDRYTTIGRHSRGIVVAAPQMMARKPPVTEYRPDFDYFDWFIEGSAQLLQFLSEQRLVSQRAISARKAMVLREAAFKRILFERASRIIKRPHVHDILRRGYRDCWEYWLMCLPALYVPGLGALVRLVKPV